MGKEASAGDICACGQRFAFPKYHWPHCPANPKNMSKPMLDNLERTFSKQQLAIIAANGPNVETLQASVAARPLKSKKKGGR